MDIDDDMAHIIYVNKYTNQNQLLSHIYWIGISFNKSSSQNRIHVEKYFGSCYNKMLYNQMYLS